MDGFIAGWVAGEMDFKAISGSKLKLKLSLAIDKFDCWYPMTGLNTLYIQRNCKYFCLTVDTLVDGKMI